jgi:hypothetical protein
MEISIKKNNKFLNLKSENIDKNPFLFFFEDLSKNFYKINI